MYTICPRCGNEAQITIVSHNQHRHSFGALDCLDLYEKAKQPGGTAITGRCPHLEAAVSEAIEQYRR